VCSSDLASFRSIKETVTGAEFVILCTPLRETPRIIREITEDLDPNTILCEIASVKQHIIPSLLEASKKGIKPLSVHPMFGPGFSNLTGLVMALIPVNNKDAEIELASKIFPGLNLKPIDAENHDRCMALILSLPYFMNLAFASMLTGEELSILNAFAGTTFMAQLTIAQCVSDELPELVESLINCNTFSEEVINQFIDESRSLQQLLKNSPNKIDSYCRIVRDSMSRDPGFKDARNARARFIAQLGKDHNHDSE
jgi:prephenate dehydrogenase